MKTFSQLILKAGKARTKPVLAVAPAHDRRVLALLPDLSGLVQPLLIGNTRSIRNSLKKLGLQPAYEIVHEPDEKAALGSALRLVREGRAGIIMEGGSDHAHFLEELGRIPQKRGASTIISHVNVVEFSLHRKCVIITDAVLNPQPNLMDRIAILNNALSVTRAMGRTSPRVAALSAIEYVNPSIPSTLYAAILSKMSQRGQFGDALVEGPLDIDCAVSVEACERKGVKSAVTGDVDLFLVTDAESGSCFVQFLNVFGGMRTTGLIVGTPAPVIPNPRLPGCSDAVAAAALACLLVR
jgi:phosphate butyryltransferase